jgi:glycosyltransferase involved in cell wall biosynthesis
MASKKIVEVCLSDGLGGLELFVVNCNEVFSKKSATVIALQKGAKLDDYLDSQQMRVYLNRNKFFPFISALTLARYIDRENIDVLHFHWNKDSLMVVLAKLFSKKRPKIIQSRHMGMTRFKDDLYHRFVYKNIDMIHAVTKEVAQQLQKYIPEDILPQISVIYPGVSEGNIKQEKLLHLRKKHQLTENDFIVGIVGRIEEAKGQYKVIEALHILQKKDVKLFVVGAPMQESYLAELKQKVQQFGLEQQVIFVGFTKDVESYMQLFDAHVLATKHETFGLVVIEAMIHKAVSIATAVGGPLEIIKNGVDGLLFDGSSEDLAKKIVLIYEDKNMLKHLKEAGYMKVKEMFDKEKQLEKLYDTLTQI